MILSVNNRIEEFSKYLQFTLNMHQQNPEDHIMIVRARGSACNLAIFVNEMVRQYFNLTNTIINIGIERIGEANKQIPYIEIKSDIEFVIKNTITEPTKLVTETEEVKQDFYRKKPKHWNLKDVKSKEIEEEENIIIEEN
jgi:DNA-binding protein